MSDSLFFFCNGDFFFGQRARECQRAADKRPMIYVRAGDKKSPEDNFRTRTEKRNQEKKMGKIDKSENEAKIEERKVLLDISSSFFLVYISRTKHDASPYVTKDNDTFLSPPSSNVFSHS